VEAQGVVVDEELRRLERTHELYCRVVAGSAGCQAGKRGPLDVVD
jgi:hypothetical protein